VLDLSTVLAGPGCGRLLTTERNYFAEETPKRHTRGAPLTAPLPGETRHFAAFDRREARFVRRSRRTSGSRNTCAASRAGSGNRLRAANRRGRSIDQAEPVASARATRASSGCG
jgi:hypothetical protein